MHTFTFTFETFELKDDVSKIEPGIQAFGKITKKGEKADHEGNFPTLVEFELNKKFLDDDRLRRGNFDFSVGVEIFNMYLPKKA